MSLYSVVLMPRARKDLDDFYGKQLARFEEIIMGLHDDPRPRNSKKLSGGGSKWRIRIGDYRLLYELDDTRKIVQLYRVAHRSEVYR